MSRKRNPNEYKNRRAKLLAAGLCLTCSKQNDNTGPTCTVCKKRKNTLRRTRHKQRQIAGICPCGTPITTGKSCERCKELKKLDRKRTRQQRKESLTQVCPTCGKPTGRTLYCDQCSTRATKSTLEKYYSRKTSRNCIVCGKPLQKTEKYRCHSCNTIHINREQQHRYYVIEQYGGKCKCCSELIVRFLELDHINNDGADHRKTIRTNLIYRWASKNNFPDSLQLLCANCNRGRAKFNICPHHQDPQIPKTKWGQKTRRRRQRIINYYGGKCYCCSESNWAFLEFDHINNDGAEHRKETKDLMSWIIKNNFPKNIGLLCSNCNKAKGLYGTCPHKAGGQSK